MKRLLTTVGISLVSLCVAAGVVLAISNAHQPTVRSIHKATTPITTICSVDAAKLLDLINQERASIAVNTLTIDSALVRSSTDKLNDMVAGQYYGHKLLNGDEPWVFMKESGVTGTVSEDLDVNALSPEDDWNALKKSPAHYASLTSSTYSRIGIATKCTDFTISHGTGPADNSSLIGQKANELTVIHLASPEPSRCATTTCRDGSCSSSTGRGTCSWHDGVAY